METKEIASVLNDLIETLKDGQEGYRLAAADTTSVETRSLFEQLSLERSKFAGELQALVRGLGKDYETTSSLAGSMHRGWINLKAALTNKDDHAVLAECERGDDSAVEQFQDALESDALPQDIREVVTHQAVAVKAAHDRVRALRDRLAPAS